MNLLQAQANARLAKEEKEFKSTIVVSENDMFVLPNTSTATKRNSKKPKRFTNDESLMDDPEAEVVMKSKRRQQTEPNVTILTTNTTESECHNIDDQQRNDFIKSVQHVRVVAEPIPDTDIEPWCMIHCLYKCHCKGRSQKGRAFNFSNKKTMQNHTLGGWEVISPRKRQYTFEREFGTVTAEPPMKHRKTLDYLVLANEQTARSSIFNWRRKPRKTALEMKTLKNTCLFNETPFSDMLKERIEICRNYNKAQNMLMKSMENDKFSKPIRMNSDISECAIESSETVGPSLTSEASVRRLNDVISDTMQRLTTNQRDNKLILNKSTNKLSIVCWDRVVEGFNARELFVWDVILANNNRTLLLTDSFVRPLNSRFLSVSNIQYMDINELPTIAKLLRMSVSNDKTKYLGENQIRLFCVFRSNSTID